MASALALLDLDYTGTGTADAELIPPPRARRRPQRPRFEPLSAFSDRDLRSVEQVESRGQRFPSWLDDAITVINKLLALPEDWDSYGGMPVQASAAEPAVALAVEAATRGLLRPVIVPTAGGGLQLEWHLPGYDLELQISPDGSELALFEQNDGNTLEETIERNSVALEAAISRLLARQTSQAHA